nr:hypothetical protein [uncultured Psychroserpens sp.]
MKKIVLLVPCIILLVLTSCDGRTSKKERLEHAISEFNKNQKLTSVKHYYPESYAETKTDSLISKTFKVSIKNYTSMDSQILLNQSVKDLKMTSKYHRSFESEIIVTVQDEIIFKRHISAEKFRDISPSEFWKNATLEHVWVNQEISNDKKLILGISFINPKNESYKLYEMRIDKSGNERLTLIEDHS